MKHVLAFTCLLLLFTACDKETGTDAPKPTVPEALYFPPATGTGWEFISPAALNWNQSEIASLFSFLQQKGTKAFIVLKGGRIAMEQYFGTFKADSNWYWASAGKTMTAMLVGIAQQEGKLDINQPTSRYLGAGWTSLPAAKEGMITVRHQLNMSTGLDDGSVDVDCTLPSCLTYKADPGSRWAYHNAPYTLLDKVVERATGTTYNAYFQQKIRDRIGMNGLWVRSGYNNVFVSTPRSMARFGLLLLNRGVWNGTPILSDTGYFNSQVNSSQSLNPSYGYLTWLNGKAQHMLPTLQARFNGALIPNAPADMYCALGKNDQKIYVVPSKQLVVIRMGDSAGNVQLALSSFDNELWGRLNQVIK